jgi:tRNA nucleotidyltransferase (CCA-adding enzyme)
MDDLFINAVPVLEKIEKAGYEAYFVGGSVRDMLMKKPIHDVDIATSATPQEVKAIFPKTIDLGIEHGTVLVLFNGNSYEVTTFRTESAYSDFRRPDNVEFVRSLEEDLKRRDFTINAIAMKKNGDLADPLGGRNDIIEKKIITVGNPDERFHEDALRMMRAVRFVSQLSFELDKNTYFSLKKNSHLLEKIAVERIFSEFEKLLNGDNRKTAIRIIFESGLYRYLPCFNRHGKELNQFISLPLTRLTNLNETWSLLLLVFNEHNPESFLREWKMPVRQIREILRIIKLTKVWQQAVKDKYVLFEAGVNEAVMATRVHSILKGHDENSAVSQIKETFDGMPIKDISDLSVNGTDLISWYDRKPGPWVKEELVFIVRGVLESNIANDKEQIREWLRNCGRM